MPDNLTANPGVGGATFATDDIAGVHYPRTKVSWGADGAAVDVSAADPLPVTVGNFPASQAVTGTFWQATQPVSGTVGVSGSVAVTGTFFQATQPVSIAASVAVTGPLTDAQLRAVAVPVSGTFWQATQPVSGTVTVNTISGFATEATLAARIPANGQALMAASVPVTIASNQSALPVSGTFFQATQPVSIAGTVAVSGPLTDTQLRASAVPVSLTSTTVTGSVAVTGTFWQATQPVSLTSTTITGTVATTAPTLTKGTQGANGWTVQQLKDAGRSAVHFYMVIPVLTSATDTLQSLTGTRAGATVAATTTPAVVTAGKALRITRLAATYVATATSGYGVVRLRFNTAGVVAITSPVAATFAVGAGTPATANSCGIEEATLSDGWEFAAGTGIGVSAQGFTAVTATAVGYVMVSVTGFEY